MITKTKDPIVANGTSLRGYVEITYDALVKKFGEPNGLPDTGKQDAEWVLSTPKGIATIYNYKNGKNYCGEDGLAVWEIEEWNIGGHNDDVVEVIKQALGE